MSIIMYTIFQTVTETQIEHQLFKVLHTTPFLFSQSGMFLTFKF